MELWEGTWVNAAAPAYPCVRAPPQLNHKVGDVARSSAEWFPVPTERLTRVLAVNHEDD